MHQDGFIFRLSFVRRLSVRSVDWLGSQPTRGTNPSAATRRAHGMPRQPGVGLHWLSPPNDDPRPPEMMAHSWMMNHHERVDVAASGWWYTWDYDDTVLASVVGSMYDNNAMIDCIHAATR
jgi:hypothetical protein